MRWRHLTTFSVLSFAALAASKPDFTGDWELDVRKSDFGSAPKPARMTVVSTMEGEMMKSVQTTYLAQDTQTAEFTWYVDGKRHATDKPVPGFSVTHWEDSMLVSDRQSNDGAYKQTIKMTLTEDGATALETVETKTPGGSNKAKLVFHRRGQPLKRY